MMEFREGLWKSPPIRPSLCGTTDGLHIIQIRTDHLILKAHLNERADRRAVDVLEA